MSIISGPFNVNINPDDVSDIIYQAGNIVVIPLESGGQINIHMNVALCIEAALIKARKNILCSTENNKS